MLAWLFVPIGVLIIIFADKIYDFIGDIDFAERYLGAGGTYSFIKLMGLAVTVVSFMWAVGGIQDVLIATFGQFF